MKRYLPHALAIIVLASCSSPKYTYHFDRYDYNKGKQQKVSQADFEVSPISVNDQTLLASTDAHVVLLPETPSVPADVTSNHNSLTKTEKKEVRKEAVKSVKEYVKAVKAGEKEKAEQMAKAMDSDLRWAAIFGAIGITALIIGGDVFYIIGGIAMIVAVVFLVKWLIRQ